MNQEHENKGKEMIKMVIEKFRLFLGLIKFKHTVFALPFAYLGMMMARKSWPSWGVFFWVTAAMVGARTAGMTLNRILDRAMDAKNPRTSNRPTVTGEISVPVAWGGVVLSLAVFFFSAWILNPLCFRLSPFALIFLVGYHAVKRFSFLCHFTLGATLAIAPMGGWIGATGSFAWQSVPLSLAVLFWVAGFDILYSLQDMDFDRAYGLHSIPARFGQHRALQVSRYCHLATVIFLILFGLVLWLGALYWVGCAVAAILLKIEHGLVGDGNLEKINTVFFTINGWIGILLLIFSFLEIFR